MSEIKTWVFRGEANERLKETDFAGEINIMFMWLFFFLNWLNHFVLMLVRVSCWLGRGWCAPARWPGISRVTSAWIAHESPSSEQHKSLHYTAQGFDPAFPTKAAPALPSFPCTKSEEQNVPNEQSALQRTCLDLKEKVTNQMCPLSSPVGITTGQILDSAFWVLWCSH